MKVKSISILFDCKMLLVKSTLKGKSVQSNTYLVRERFGDEKKCEKRVIKEKREGKKEIESKRDK